jgi:hypothetical protein
MSVVTFQAAKRQGQVERLAVERVNLRRPDRFCQRWRQGSGKILVYQAARRQFPSGFSRPSNTAARTKATR